MIRILFVLGASRCGSSVLGATLGGVAGVVNVGELTNLWSVCLSRDGFPCGCGRPVADCPFWTAVRRESGVLDQPVDDMVAMQQRDIGGRDLRHGLTGTGAPSEFVQRLVDVYGEVSRSADAALVVDTSKSPAFAAAVATHPEVSVVAAHVVRDPRGHVVSQHRGWQAAQGLDHPWDRRAAAHAVLAWSKANAAVETLTLRSRRHTTRIRYEDFMAAPRKQTALLLRLAGHDAPVDNIDGALVRTGVQHFLAGSRHAVGQTTRLRQDDVWKRFLSPSAQRAAFLLGLPLTARYGYPVAARPDPEGAR